MSAAVALATCASGSSVAGLTVVNVSPSGRLDLAAVDEQPVAVLDRDDVARLRRRRVLPRDRGTVAEAPARRSVLDAGHGRAPFVAAGSAGVFVAIAAMPRRAAPRLTASRTGRARRRIRARQAG